MTGDDKEENCKEKVLQFLCGKMKMELQDTEIEVAHRLGTKKVKQQQIKPRSMLVRCKFELRDRIFKFTKQLKDQHNELGDPYFVRQQLPEPLLSEKMERDSHLSEIRKSNAAIPDEQKHKRITAEIK